MHRYTGIAAVVVAGLALAACADDMSDLRQEVSEIRQRPGGEIEPLPEFVPYESFTYVSQDLRDPFIPARAFAEAQEQEEDPGSGIAPDHDRPREPLERYPLDSLKMVGTLSRGEQLWGLVRSPDGTVHQVLEGNYLGQNHGQITSVQGNRIQLVEIVRDGSDAWMERDASLGLGEEG
jgi:type IV pilus assembly protein PilP